LTTHYDAARALAGVIDNPEQLVDGHDRLTHRLDEPVLTLHPPVSQSIDRLRFVILMTDTWRVKKLPNNNNNNNNNRRNCDKLWQTDNYNNLGGRGENRLTFARAVQTLQHHAARADEQH